MTSHLTGALGKDATASSVHKPTALGNQRRKRSATLFSDIGKPAGRDPQISVADVQKFVPVLKVDESLGLVFGWAIVCKQDGADYFDLQDDHIPEASMLKASADFMASARVARQMHAGEAAGTVVFAFPMTSDIAKAFGVETKTTGLMIALKPDDKAMLDKFRDGTYTGFSIGGWRVTDEEA